MNDWEYSLEYCPKCGATAAQQDCTAIDCEDGYIHDCGEDCCCCLDPEPNFACEECHGRGGHLWCRACGWDLYEKRYLNGRSELVEALAAGEGK